MDDERLRRADAIAGRAAALDRQRDLEIAKARGLIADFVTAMQARGVPPVQLRARVPGRRTTYRTSRAGWYIRQNESLAIGTGGDFYVLDVPVSLRARLFGADVQPSDPPLVLGRGARDGESIELAELLRRALPRS
ncbi:MAG TPA: hypothetical protein VFR23_25905 [Jiangellaceae bacterium]|nr:hypothetical protein [Jiangellaceae bacterium]